MENQEMLRKRGCAVKNAEKRRKTQENMEKPGNPQKNAVWGHLGRALGMFWSLLGTLGALLGGCWRLLRRPWDALGASWTPLGRNLEKKLLVPVLGGPTWRPKSIQGGSKIQEKSM